MRSAESRCPTVAATSSCGCEWTAGRFDAISTRIGLRDTTLVATTTVAADPLLAVTPRAAFEQLSFVARWQRSGENWSFDLADGAMTRRGISSTGARLHVERSGGDPAQYRVAASGIDLEPLGSLAMLAKDLPAGLRNWLYLANPQGTLEAAEFDWNSRDDFRIDALLDRFAAHDAQRIPGIDPLRARLRGDAQALLLELPQQATRIDYPFAFQAPFEFNQLAGDIVAWRDEGAGHVQTPQLDVAARHYAIDLRGGIEFQGDGSKPLLDALRWSRMPMCGGKSVLDETPMSRKTIDWLDRALVAGKAARCASCSTATR